MKTYMSKAGSDQGASSARSRLAARRAIWAAAKKSSEAGTETPSGSAALARQRIEVPAPRPATSEALTSAKVVGHSADRAEEAARQAQKAKEDASAAKERAKVLAEEFAKAKQERLKAEAREKEARAEQLRLSAEEERARSWSGTFSQAGRDLFSRKRPVNAATRVQRVQAAAESVKEAEVALKSERKKFVQAWSAKYKAARVAAEAEERIQEIQDAATIAAVGARAVTSANLQLVVRDEVRSIILESSAESTEEQLAQAIASRVVTLSRPPRLEGSAVSAATRGAGPADHAAESDAQLAARRSAAIVGAFQGLAPKDRTGALGGKVALEIIKATMPDKLLDKITKSPERRLLPFATKVAEAGAVVAALTGAVVLAGGALPVTWLAPLLFLPQVATRLGSAVRNLVRGVPDQKRRQAIADLLGSTLRAAKYIEDTQLVGQMAAALVASLQSANPGLNKAWLKEIAIDAAPEQHRAAVEAAVKTVAPGRLATGINYWFGTNFGGRQVHIR